MKIASIDIETTGLDPKLHSITEIAIVLGDSDSRVIHDELYLWVYPENMIWSAYCLNLHKDWLTRCMFAWDEWKRKAIQPIVPIIEPVNVKQYVEDWLKTREVKRNYIPAGKNFGSFDRQFLKQNGIDSFKHRQLDPAAYYHRKGDLVPPELALCKQRAKEQGAPNIFDDKVAHNAIEDARDVFWLECHGLARFEAHYD